MVNNAANTKEDKQVDKHEEIKTGTDHYNCVFENLLAKQFFKVL